ncbi:MAG: aminoacetone oxidase family FAD-binding enzyme, partial [Clostridia bacterium]|nr:aminoacetone oxidase family FAD-binding enzyme [Clostridia bacterium]
MKQIDLIVIGAGASGYAAAITAAKMGLRVRLIDGSAKTARKVAASGNGRCNLSNLDVTPSRYSTSNPERLAEILALGQGKVADFFADLGVLTVADEAGRLYPWSNRSASVVDALVLSAQALGVEQTTAQVTGILPQGEGYLVQTDVGAFFAPQVIVAVGSPASPSVGGRDNPWVEALGLATIPYRPALVALTVDKRYFSLKGCRAKAQATLSDGGKSVRKEEGEVLFGEGTLSGILSMQLSLDLPKCAHPTVELDLLPTLSEEDVKQALIARREGQKAEKLFVGLLDKPLAYCLLKEAGVSLDEISVSDAKLAQVAHRAKHW